MDKSQGNYAEEKEPDKKNIMYNSIYIKFYKRLTKLHDRKQICDCLGKRGEEGRIVKRVRNLLESSRDPRKGFEWGRMIMHVTTLQIPPSTYGSFNKSVYQILLKENWNTSSNRHPHQDP